VLLIGETCDPSSVEAVRASMGSIFAVPVYEGSEEDFVALARSAGPAPSSARRCPRRRITAARS
jgi:tRNA G18 (ribose-2'-O)-methylase SpoU